jgi:hypothetical protein
MATGGGGDDDEDDDGVEEKLGEIATDLQCPSDPSSVSYIQHHIKCQSQNMQHNYSLSVANIIWRTPNQLENVTI